MRARAHNVLSVVIMRDGVGGGIVEEHNELLQHAIILRFGH